MITDNYIKMCEQAEEIQEAWKQNPGDIYIYKKDIDIGLYYYVTEYKKHNNAVWLPTQEQLQEIIKPTLETDDFELVELFFDFVYGEDSQPNQINSPIKLMNEMWLAFVMHEKYNKIWTGEKWEVKNVK